MANFAPPAVGTSSQVGVSTSAARGDHTHADAPVPSDIALSTSWVCISSVAVLDAVYQSTTNTVDRANAASLSTGPCIGFVASKADSTHATVQYAGPLGGFSGLTPDTDYYVNTANGAITNNYSGFAAGTFVQRVGFAKDATTLIVAISPVRVVL